MATTKMICAGRYQVSLRGQLFIVARIVSGPDKGLWVAYEEQRMGRMTQCYPTKKQATAAAAYLAESGLK